MNDYQRRKFEMFLKVRDFFTQYGAIFPATAVAAMLFAALLALITQFETLAGEKISKTGKAAQSMDVKEDARQHLRDWLRDIADIAKQMAYDTGGLENLFRMPRGNNDANLIAAARSFAADAAAYKAQFIAYGLETDFIEELTEAADRLEQALGASGAATQSRIGANAAFDPLIKEATRTVERLNPLVRRAYRNNAAALAAWTYATHLERAPKPAKAKESE